MKPLGDLNWRLAPLISFLNAMGGWGFKWIRRLGCPIAVVLFTFLYYRFKKKRYFVLYPILLLTSYFSFTLPLTLVGDSIPHYWQNWIWVGFFGAVQVSGLFPLAFFGELKVRRWMVCLIIHSIFSAFLLTLSNTLGYPTHSWVEAGIGMSYGGLAAWLIEPE